MRGGGGGGGGLNGSNTLHVNLSLESHFHCDGNISRNIFFNEKWNILVNIYMFFPHLAPRQRSSKLNLVCHLQTLYSSGLVRLIVRIGLFGVESLVFVFVMFILLAEFSFLYILVLNHYFTCLQANLWPSHHSSYLQWLQYDKCDMFQIFYKSLKFYWSKMNTALPSPPPSINFDKIVLVQWYTLCNVENSVKNQKKTRSAQLSL